ncbi:hypothetical protein FWF74_01415 [Candidatus Saccharibacteria bacterium]|nr:hypothetical protein [Candidatus Saccharibacteria bacterium]MCL1963110.1 hypothetical protein [Candidatus Saccharibacteria bacterium]
MNNGGDSNYWQPDSSKDPFAPVQSNPNAPPAEPAQDAPAPDATPPVEPATEPDTQPNAEISNPETPETNPDQPDLPAFEPIKWSSSNTIDHERGAGWHLALFGIAGLIIAGMIGLSLWKGWSASNISIIGLVAVIVIAILVVSKKPSVETNYMLTESGLTINSTLHPFSEFRAFGVHQDGALWQLTLIPVRRFGAAITTFINSDQGEIIVDVLGARLPMEEISTHPIDKLTRLLKL